MKIFISIVVSIFIFSNFSFAADKKVVDTYKQIQELQKRVEQLENKKNISWVDRIKLNGVIEVEFSYVNNKGNNGVEDKSETKIELSKVELDFSFNLHKYASAFANILYEGDGIDIDEAAIRLGNTENYPVFLQAGKYVVQFGIYESMFITDPETKNLGETNAGAVSIGFENYGVTASVYSFSQDVDKKDENNKGLNYGVGVAYNFKNILPKNISLFIATSYIDTITGTSAFEDTEIDEVDDYVGAYSLFGQLDLFNFTLIGEYVSTTDKFDKNDYQKFDKNYQPRALNLELGYTFPYLNANEMTVALRYEDVKEMFDTDYNVYGAVVSAEIFKIEDLNTLVSLSGEYLHTDFDEGNIDKSDSFIVQLTAEF